MEFTEAETFYTLIFSLAAFLTIFPPHEVKSAGLTLDNLFQSYFGDPNIRFVMYHMRRTAVTKCVHALLPTIYLLGLAILRYPASLSTAGAFNYAFTILTMSKASYVSIMLASLSMGLAVVVITFALVNTFHDWAMDPLAASLSAHSSRGSWREVAASVDNEIRRVDKFASVVGHSKLYVTETWLIQVNLYSVHVVHQQDVRLELSKAEEYELCPESTTGSQFLEIQVRSSRNAVKPFNIRLNSLDYQDLKERLQAPIENARNIIVQQSLSEKFVQAFHEVISANPRLIHTEEVEPCIGCMQVQANVKLEKRCATEDDGTSDCRRCFCRPMWCAGCMARWFASRQDASTPEVWLGGKSPCPTCRSRFCLLDVSLLDG